jgi:sulfate transport system ATP-binding protein
VRRRVAELLDLVQLAGYEDRYPAQLSGGQRQRVALARALAIEPRVLLLDEPFGALDARVRKDLRRWLRAFHRRTGLTTIFVTHDQDEAMELADRVALLNRGRIEQVGTPDDLYDRPASAFVMSFIGEAVTIEGPSAEAVLSLNGRTAERLTEGRSKLYLRPHDFRMTAPQAGSLVGTIEAVRRTPTGHRVEIAVEHLAAPIEIDVDRTAVRPGDRVGLELAGTRLFREKPEAQE